MSRIFVTGPIGAGKTHFTSSLAQTLGWRVVALDPFFLDYDYMSGGGPERRKRSPADRDAQLAEWLDVEQVIFEGWHFGEWMIPLYRRISAAIVLDVPLELRDTRIRERHRRRKTGEEPDPFPASGDAHLHNQLKWTRSFEVAATVDEIRRDAPSECKIVITSEPGELDVQEFIRSIK